MKKPKLDEPDASGPSGRNELYQSVIDLDKSSEDASKLVDSVYNLLDLSYEGIGAPKPVSSISDHLGSPKHQWALRWCLRKLSGESPATTTLRADPRVWRLISHLLSILPANGSTKLLVGHNFDEVVKATLSSLKSGFSADNNGSVQRQGRVKSVSQLLHAEELLFSEKSDTPNKKRKRHSDSPEPSHVASFLVFQEVIQILQILRFTPESDVVFHFGKPLRLQAVFRLDVQGIAQISGDGLSIFENLLRACTESTEDPPSIDFDPITPLCVLWQNASGGVPDHEIMQNCLPFLENVLEPCLLVLDAMKRFANQVGLRQDLEVKIQRALATSFIFPFRSAVMDTRKASKDSVADAENRLGEIEARLSASSSPVSELKEDSSILLPPLFELAFSCCRRSTVSRKLQEDRWIESLMFTLCNMMDIRLKPGEDQTDTKILSLQRKRALSLILNSARLHQLQVPKQSLQSVLHVVADVKGKKFEIEQALADWSIVSSCIKIDPTTILSSKGNEPPKVTSKLFKRFSELAAITCATETNRKGEGDYESVFNIFIPDLIEAFVTTRSLPSFIKIWSEQLQTQLETDRGLSTFLIPWTDERLLSLVSRSVGNSFSPAQQAKYLEEFLGELQSSTSASSFAAALTVIGCFVSTFKGTELTPELLRHSQQLFEILADDLSRSKGERKCPQSQTWRIWRVISDIVGSVDDTDALGSNSTLQELITVAESLSLKVMKGKSKNIHSNYDGIFAVCFLEALSECRGYSANQAQEKLARVLKSLSKQMRKSDLNADATQVNISASNISVTSTQNTFQTLLGTVALQSFHDASREYSVLDCIVRQLCLSAIEERSSNLTHSAHKIGYLDAWSLLLGNSVLREQSEALDSVQVAVTEELINAVPQNASTMDSVLETLLRLHPILGLSGERKRVTDVLQNWKTQQHDNPDSTARLAKCNSLIQAINQPLSKDGQSKSTHDLELNSPASSNTFNVSDSAGGIQDSRGTTEPVVQLSIDQLAPRLESRLKEGSPFTKIDAMSLVKIKTNKAEQTEENKLALGKLCRTLLFCLRDTSSVLQYSLVAKSISHLLSHCSWGIAQFHIDTLLSIVDFHTSSRSKSLSAGAPEAVYKLLCKPFGAILSSHRAKIGGRYHLVVPALKGLLRCLFQNRASNGFVSRRIEQPLWLSGGKVGLGVDCAVDFSRLVTSLSDPTVSAARSGQSNRSQELNDPTKKARSLAGQSLQFVVIEFCSCQLRGHMEHPVREKVIPGIYSILDAMTKDVMQNMSAAMDSSQRAIFKTLYDDWNRFGKWKGG